MLSLFNILIIAKLKMPVNVKKTTFLTIVICVLMALVISQEEIQAKTPDLLGQLEFLRPGDNAVKIAGFRSASIAPATDKR